MKNLLFCLSIFALSSYATAQSFDPENIVQVTGEYVSHETFYIDSDNNEYISGVGTGAINFDLKGGHSALPANSFRDLFLAKYDDSQNLQWLLSFDGNTNSNQIRAIGTDDDGNVYIAGSMLGTLNLTDDGMNTLTAFNSSSMFVAKFDVNGAIQWSFTVGDENFSQYPDELYISDGNLIIQFVYAGTFDVDPGPNETILSGSSNALLEYDLDGNFSQVKTHKGNTSVRSSAIDADGNIVLSGSFSGLVTFDYNSNQSILGNGISNAYIVKYDKDYNLQWLKTYSKSFESMRISPVVINNQNEIIAAATFAKELSVGSFTTENDAIYLVHYSTDGEVLDLKEFMPESSPAFGLLLDSEQNLYYAANFSGTLDLDPSTDSFDIVSEAGMDNFFLAVYDPSYNLLAAGTASAADFWTRSILLNSDDRATIFTDFEGESKAVLGSSMIFSAPEDSEHLISYNISVSSCIPTMGDYSVDACDGTEVNGTLYLASGTYTQTLTNADGCDSTLNINVVIHMSSVNSVAITSCGSFELEGEIINESGNYEFNLFTANGCDSLVSLELTVIVLDTSIITNENMLSSGEVEADSWQWIDCDSGLPVTGENNMIFSPASSGSYQVEVTIGNCTETSGCVDFVLVNTIDISSDLQIIPNPASDNVFIKIANVESYEVSILNITGLEILKSKSMQSDGQLDISDLHAGIYFVQLVRDNQVAIQKVVVY